VPSKSLFTKIAGVSYTNTDGGHRQGYISELKVGDMLSLRKDGDCKFDANAVTIWDCKGRQLGFLKKDKELSTLIAPLVESGLVTSASVISLTGGTKDKELRGVNIRIDNIPDDVADKYFANFPSQPKTQVQEAEHGDYCEQGPDIFDVFGVEGLANISDYDDDPRVRAYFNNDGGAQNDFDDYSENEEDD
jgi:hypothetical protein